MEEVISHGPRHNFEVALSSEKGISLSPNLSYNSLNSLTSDEDSHASSDSDSPRESVSASKYSIEKRLSDIIGADVYNLAANQTIPDFMKSRIEDKSETGSFLVTNLATLVQQYKQWTTELPQVVPFYAVKCNPDPQILKLLASLGCCFDCATMGEIDLVLHGLGDNLSFAKRGLAASSIVYANPAHMEHMLEYAIENGVRMTVFDGEDELYKIASLAGHENMQLLLRLTTDDQASKCRFSKKFGCPVAEAPHLLEVAKSLGLNVMGVSFHVGSGCGDPRAYYTAIDHARRVFDAAESFGMPRMTMVDLGGGFPGGIGGIAADGMPTFQQLAAAIREGLQDFFYSDEKYSSIIKVIAEPGRYFAHSTTSVATKIYSRKGGNANYQALYVDDGVYGSFNNVIYDHAALTPKRLYAHGDNETEIPTAVFGPTCDGLDQMCALDSTVLPRCEVNDWLYWEDMGAYTHTASFVFNGYTHRPKKTYVYSA